MARLQSEIPLLRSRTGEELLTVNTAEDKARRPRRQVDLGHVPKAFMEPIRGFHDLLRQWPASLDIVRAEFNLNDLLNNAVHISDFRGEDIRIVELNAVYLVDTVFSCGRLVRMF
jgi:hypothetical protein